jgi:hypothetical protein
MPYDPDNPDEFRQILEIISKKWSLSSEQIIDLLEKNQKQEADRLNITFKLSGKPFGLSPGSLGRFRRGGNIRAREGLSELWKVLESHKLYKKIFVSSQDAAPLYSPDKAMAEALNLFFSESTNPKAPVDISALRKKLSGRYTMYRPQRHGMKESGYIMTSLIEILDIDSDISVREVQNFRKNRYLGKFEQNDVGFLFTYGRHIYFLLKGVHVEAVKLGIIEEYFPDTLEQWTNFFSGSLYVASHLARYPLAKFICTPYLESSTFESAETLVKDIIDVRVRKFFMDNPPDHSSAE